MEVMKTKIINSEDDMLSVIFVGTVRARRRRARRHRPITSRHTTQREHKNAHHFPHVYEVMDLDAPSASRIKELQVLHAPRGLTGSRLGARDLPCLSQALCEAGDSEPSAASLLERYGGALTASDGTGPFPLHHALWAATASFAQAKYAVALAALQASPHRRSVVHGNPGSRSRTSSACGS